MGVASFVIFGIELGTFKIAVPFVPIINLIPRMKISQRRCPNQLAKVNEYLNLKRGSQVVAFEYTPAWRQQQAKRSEMLRHKKWSKFVLECALRPQGMNSNVFVDSMQAFLTPATRTTVNKFPTNRLRQRELGKTKSPQIDAS